MIRLLALEQVDSNTNSGNSGFMSEIGPDVRVEFFREMEKVKRKEDVYELPHGSLIPIFHFSENLAFQLI